jgi:thymidylate kinase
MIVIFEGLDRSGKTFYADLMKQNNIGSVLIKRQHEQSLYPIDYNEGSKYDWQAMFDRIILANPDTLFLADRSFFTHMIYQTCLVHDNPIKHEHVVWFNKYCKLLTMIPHLVVYTESNKYELDGMIVNRNLRDKISDMYRRVLSNITDLNYITLDIDHSCLYDNLMKIQTEIDNIKIQ